MAPGDLAAAALVADAAADLVADAVLGRDAADADSPKGGTAALRGIGHGSHGNAFSNLDAAALAALPTPARRTTLALGAKVANSLSPKENAEDVLRDTSTLPDDLEPEDIPHDLKTELFADDDEAESFDVHVATVLSSKEESLIRIVNWDTVSGKTEEREEGTAEPSNAEGPSEIAVRSGETEVSSQPAEIDVESPPGHGTGTSSEGTSADVSPAAASKNGDRDGETSPCSGSDGGHSSNDPPLMVLEVYDTWCGWLDKPEEGNQLEQMLQMLTRGGEPFRSFIQFMARVSEPHRSARMPPDEFIDAIEEEAVWRSCTAMRVACHAFASLNMGAGHEGIQILRLVCCELLRGLQPRSQATSMHIAIVLQHLLGAHDLEACNAMLQYHAPFVLVRALDHPGCPELLLGLLLGVDTPLPPLSANQSLRPITTLALQQVLLYLRQTSFASLVAALLDSGARKAMACAGLSGSSPGQCSPAPRRTFQSPGTPGGRSSGWPSPGGCFLTPQRLATPSGQASPLFTLQLRSSSPSPSTEPYMALPPLPAEPQPLPCSAPAVSPLLAQTGLPPEPGSPMASDILGRSCPIQSSEGYHAQRTPQSIAGTSPAAPGTPGRLSGSGRGRMGSGSAGPHTPLGESLLKTPAGNSHNGVSPMGELATPGGLQETEDHKGVAVVVEFLTCFLETACRAADQLARSKHAPDVDSEVRADTRLELLQLVFVESSIIPHLFSLLRVGVAQFESAALLQLLMTCTLNPNRKLGSLLEPLLGHFLPHVEMLGTLLMKNVPKSAGGAQAAASRGARGMAWKKGDLRLNAYTVSEPLGALRVAAVQILAGLVDLAPERTLAALRPAVWGFLVHAFFKYRCNHIFQASCGRLFIAVVQHGNARLQHLVLRKSKLLAGLCEIVLAEGACGDKWDELRPLASANTTVGKRIEKAQVAISQKRHPGGLGGLTPVVIALMTAQKDAADEACAQKAGCDHDDAGTMEADDSLGNLKPLGHSHIVVAKLLADTSNWPQVAYIVGQAMLSNRSNSLR